MKKFSATVLLVTVFISLFSVPAAANRTEYMVEDFQDLVYATGEEHWAYQQMSELIAMGILKGFTGVIKDEETGEYIEVQFARPEQKITRAEFATLLYQALNYEPEGQAAFTDEIPFWAREAISALASKGIIKGYQDGTFKANKNISRAEIATMLVKALNDQKQQTGRNFPDVPSRHWAHGYIQKASAMGIINGLPNGNFAPDRSAKRAEVMVMLYQFILNDRSNAPEDSELLARTDELLRAMEAAVNGAGQIDLSTAAPYLTGEQEAKLSEVEAVLNELKQVGTLNYRVTYPGTVVKKSDRWAEVVYETVAAFKAPDLDVDEEIFAKEHYYLMKIGGQWYIYSEMDEELLN